MRVLLVAIGIVGVLVGGLALAGAGQSGPATLEQQQIQAIAGLLLAEREKTEALAASAATKTQQIAQLQQQIAAAPAACIANIEKANAGKTVDAKTWIIGPTPAAGK